jgi:hypothetical protein
MKFGLLKSNDTRRIGRQQKVERVERDPRALRIHGWKGKGLDRCQWRKIVEKTETSAALCNTTEEETKVIDVGPRVICVRVFMQCVLLVFFPWFVFK